MSDFETVKADYLQKKSEIEQIKLKVNHVNDEIRGLNEQICEAQAPVLEINERLKHSARDLADGSLSSVDFLALKQTLREKEEFIKDLMDVVTAQEEAKFELVGESVYSGLKKENAILLRIKLKLIKQLTELTASNLSSSTKDEVKELIQLVASGEKYSRSWGKLGGDVYFDLGQALLHAVLPLNANGVQEHQCSPINSTRGTNLATRELIKDCKDVPVKIAF